MIRVIQHLDAAPGQLIPPQDLQDFLLHSLQAGRQNILPQLLSRGNNFGVVEFGGQLVWERMRVLKRRDEFSLSDELGVPPQVLVAGQLTVESALGLGKLLFPTNVTKRYNRPDSRSLDPIFRQGTHPTTHSLVRGLSASRLQIEPQALLTDPRPTT